MRNILTAVLLIAVVIILAAFVHDKGLFVSRYREVVAQNQTISHLISTVGRVQPANRVDIKAPIPGRAESITAQLGDRVERGQLLLSMSSSERAAMLDAADAMGGKEKARWEKDLPANPIVAQISGIVIQRLIEEGQSFTETTNLFVLADRYVVEAPIDETDLARIQVGQTVKVVLDAISDQELDGHVGSIGFDARDEEGVTTFRLKIEFENVPDWVRVGMTANLNFHLDPQTNATVIPTEALNSRGEEMFVLVPASSGSEPEERIVKVGVSDRSLTQIVSGLNPGDKVLIAKPDAHKSTAMKSAFGPAM